MSGFNCLNCLVSNVFNVASVSLSFWSKFYNCLVFNVYMVLSSMSTWSGLKCLNGLSCLIVSNVFSSMSSMSQMSGLPCLHVSPTWSTLSQCLTCFRSPCLNCLTCLVSSTLSSWSCLPRFLNIFLNAHPPYFIKLLSMVASVSRMR